jgi:hypothetical protein
VHGDGLQTAVEAPLPDVAVTAPVESFAFAPHAPNTTAGTASATISSEPRTTARIAGETSAAL